MISAGEPGQWKEVAAYDCGRIPGLGRNQAGRDHPLRADHPQDAGHQFQRDRRLRVHREAYQAMLARKAEEARREAERQAALKKAREEALRRPLVEMAALRHAVAGRRDRLRGRPAPTADSAEVAGGGEPRRDDPGTPGRVLPPTRASAPTSPTASASSSCCGPAACMCWRWTIPKTPRAAWW